MISVIIPLYNKEMYIEQTINNVLKQTFDDFEIVVINDGSTDNSIKIVESFKNKKIRLFHKENGGVSSARNLGIRNAKYEYIAFLDADDEWSPNHLEEIYKLISDYGNEADMFVTNFARKYPDGTISDNRNYNELPRGIIKNYFSTILKKAAAHTSSVCVRKSVLLEIGLFVENFSYGEDIDLWNKIARKYKIAYSPVITEIYQIGTLNNASIIKNYDKVAANYINLRYSINIYDYIFNLLRFIKIKVRKKIL